MVHKKHIGNFGWDSVQVLPYKEDGTHFKSISRQVLFDGDADLQCQLRYFEIESGGHSTLERHEHVHVVMVVSGSGKALVNDEIVTLDLFDVLHIPKLQWHQLQACNSEKLGFLCIVHSERDRPHRPNSQELEALKSNPLVASFLKV